MQYSLLNRFIGSLAGSLSGQDDQLRVLSELGTELGDRLIAEDKLQDKDGQQLYQKYQDRLKFPLNSSHLLLATLPLQLRYYDDRLQLQAQLDTLEKTWQQSRLSLEDVLVWSYGLGLAIEEKLQPQILPRQILEAFPTLHTPLLESLKKLANLLPNYSPLWQILAHFPGDPNRAILAAFSCFIASPEEAKLSLGRAEHCPLEPHLVMALSGVISGAYNSIVGLPLSWRVSQENLGVISSVEKQAQSLLARWCGVYGVPSHPLLSHQGLGKFGLIQRRESLRIISQKET